MNLVVCTYSSALKPLHKLTVKHIIPVGLQGVLRDLAKVPSSGMQDSVLRVSEQVSIQLWNNP